MSDLVQIRFDLEQDEDGYPPARSETVWAKDLGNDEYRLMNAPMFADGVSVNDVIKARDSDGDLTFTAIKSRGGHSTLRVFVPEGAHAFGLIRQLESLGANLEESKDYNMYVVDVPSEASLRSVYEVLERHRKQQSIDYWTGDISSAHDREELPT